MPDGVRTNAKCATTSGRTRQPPKQAAPGACKGEDKRQDDCKKQAAPGAREGEDKRQDECKKPGSKASGRTQDARQRQDECKMREGVRTNTTAIATSSARRVQGQMAAKTSVRTNARSKTAAKTKSARTSPSNRRQAPALKARMGCDKASYGRQGDAR